MKCMRSGVEPQIVEVVPQFTVASYSTENLGVFDRFLVQRYVNSRINVAVCNDTINEHIMIADLVN